jgi:hypothetical protein
MPRIKTKTEVATIKLTPQCRLAWEAAAASQTRSLANMFEVAILEYCKQNGIAVPEVPVHPAASSSPRVTSRRSYPLAQPAKDTKRAKPHA